MPLENTENHEIIGIPHENNQIMKINDTHTRLTKIMKIQTFHANI